MGGERNSPADCLRLDGETDWRVPERVQRIYRTALRRLRRGHRLLLDLRDVRMLDSKLIAALIALQRRAGGRLRIYASDQVRAWLDAYRLRRLTR